jgi:O-antigen ligase
MAVLPLPFGAVIERARIPLIVVPLGIAIVATVLRLYAARDRENTSQPTVPWLIWTGGAIAFLAVAALQLIPLPPTLLRVASPESHAIWSRAVSIAGLARVPVGASHPITIDPQATLFEWFRLASLLGAFLAAALLVRTSARRLTVACVICLTAMFESLYGVREAAMQRYQIWGWTNRLIFNRVTGTFVNPNHFAHYLAIAVPMALFVAAFAWYRSGNEHTPLRRRIVLLVEREVVWTALSFICAIICILGILLARSRGALLALGAGLLVIALAMPGKRVMRLSIALSTGVVLVIALVIFLGSERTSAPRFAITAGEQETLGGRRIGFDTAIGVWRRFPLLGSGVGTFERAELMEQRTDVGKTYHHAHNDYVEIAATSGAIGLLIAIATLFGGYVALMRMTFGAESLALSWLRRAFQAAALTSLTIAMIHALIDFNFFIPANPATLAVIVGAAVSVVDHDKRTRR